MSIQIVRLDKDLPLPMRAHEGDGGVDLYAREKVVLAPGERMLVATGIAVAIPMGFGGFILPRSGLAAKLGLSIVNAPGLVDAQYRGEVKVALINLGSETIELDRGSRIAQLCVMPVSLEAYEEVDELDSSVRGSGGFGSSGV